MAVDVIERHVRMSPQQFREFYDGRPETERWELFDGVPLMMSPALLIHNRIAGNLERLLNEALAIHDPGRIAQQRPGLELPESGTYRPEPDLAVFDLDFRPDQRYLDRAYLLAEIPSSTDRDRVPGQRQSRIDAKRELYRQHAFCQAVLIIEQDRMEVLVDTRTDGGWSSRTLTEPAGELVLPSFGLRCAMGDLYENTPLRSRSRMGEENGR